MDTDYKNLSNKLIALYLERKGWKWLKTNRAGIDLYIEPTLNDPVEIYLPNIKGIADYESRMIDAIKAISLVEEREESLIIHTINNLDKDFHNYRVPTNDDSVPIVLLESLLESARESLKEAAKIEHRNHLDALSGSERREARGIREETADLIDDCRFAHTWKGSFGITIEVPLWLPSYGLTANIDETLGRKTTKRIFRNLKIVNEAVKEKSYNYIFDHIGDEKDITIFYQYPRLREHLKKNVIDFDVDYSPIMAIDEPQFREKQRIDDNTLHYIEMAIDKIRYAQDIIDIEIVGFPETMKAAMEDLLKDVDV